MISTDKAPQPIGTYSQAVRMGDLVFLSGQIPIDPATNKMVEGDIQAQMAQVFKNIEGVCQASGGGLNDIVKLTLFLADFTHYPLVNEIMQTFFQPPYPARSAVGVSVLPAKAQVEMEAIMAVPKSAHKDPE